VSIDDLNGISWLIRPSLETLGDNVAGGDIWQISALFNKLVQQPLLEDDPQGSIWKLQRIASANCHGMDQISPKNESLSGMYSDIIADIVEFLSTNFPVAQRLTKENLASIVAMEVIFAIYRMRVDETEPVPQVRLTQSQEHGPDERPASPESMRSNLTVEGKGKETAKGGALQVRSEATNRVATSGDLQHIDQQVFEIPTPEPSASSIAAASTTNSVSTASSLGLVMSKSLREHAILNNPSPMLLKDSTFNIQAHWTRGEDPEMYNWTEKTKELEPDESGGGVLSQMERKRAQRRAERHLRKQRKENMKRNPNVLALSTMPGPVMNLPVRNIQSSPVPHLKTATQGQSSQSQEPNGSQGNLAISSQVVTGRHGGRLPLKKKKRLEGF
jgi:hypothetical protein